MTHEPDHAAVKRLFAQSAALPAGDRQAFLEEACAGNHELLAEVRSLLDFDQPETDLLDLDSSQTTEPVSTSMPDRIAGFEIIRMIGEGASGVVFRARQESPERDVAIKLLRTATSPTATRRFEQEARVLASLRHPRIATVYETGFAHTGAVRSPYIAMELVDGDPLIRHAERGELDTRARIGLLIEVCDGVLHAHSRGVIHRDLKPENILVDSDGQPRVLDFGIARVLGDDEVTRVTGTGQIIGTLAYISPEQLEGHHDRVDTRCDVYALGVILHELLTGALPHSRSSLVDAVRTARQPRSVRLDRSGLYRSADLEAIVNKATAAEPASRYAGVGELAADLQRYLAGDAVLARRVTGLTRLSYFASRNRIAVGIAAVMVVATVATIAALAIGLSRSREAARESAAAAETVEEVNSFLVRIFENAMPAFGQGADISIDSAVSRALEQVDAKPTTDPRSSTALRGVLADVLIATGRSSEALRHAGIAEEDARNAYGESSPEHLDAMLRQSMALLDNGETQAAEELADSVAEAESASDVQVVQAMLQRASAQRAGGDPEAAEATLSSTVLMARDRLGEESEHVAGARIALAMLLVELGRGDEALNHAESGHGVFLRSLGDRHPRTLNALSVVASVQHGFGNFSKAEALYRRALAGRISVLGATHARTLETSNNLAELLVATDRLDEALALHEESARVLRETLGEDHIDTLTTINNMAGLYSRLGRLDDAATLHAQVAQRLASTLGPQHPLTLTSLNNAGVTMRRLGRTAEAIDAFASLLEAVEPMLGEAHPTTHAVMHNLGGALYEAQRFNEAKPYFERAVELATDAGEGYPPVSRGIFLRSLGSCLFHLGELEVAADAGEASLEILRDALGDDASDTRQALAELTRTREALVEARR